MNELLTIARESSQLLFNDYQQLHACPELAFEEWETTKYIAKQIEELGLEPRILADGDGLIVDLPGSDNAKGMLAIRADIDALRHSLPDGSEITVHSCGHDANAAMALSVCRILYQRWRQVKNHQMGLRFIFQPAEENVSGAKKVIAESGIDGVTHIIAIHMRPKGEAPMGKAAPGVCHSSVMAIDITINGVSAHGGWPQQGVSVIEGMKAVMLGVEKAAAGLTWPASVKVTVARTVNTIYNIIPDRANMTLDFRAHDSAEMELIWRQVQDNIAAELAHSKVKIEYSKRFFIPGPLYDDHMLELSGQTIAEVLGEENLLPFLYTAGAEDFHCYTHARNDLKAVYLGLGADVVPGLHNPQMSFNHDALINGVAIMATLAENIIKENQ